MEGRRGARQRVDRETDRARAKQGKWKSYYSRSGREKQSHMVSDGLDTFTQDKNTCVPYPYYTVIYEKIS